MAKKGLYFSAGGYAAWFLDQKLTINGHKADISDNSPYLQKRDYGIIAGIGYRVRLSQNNKLNLELRDNIGLAKTYFTTSDKFNSIALIANWQFEL